MFAHPQLNKSLHYSKKITLKMYKNIKRRVNVTNSRDTTIPFRSKPLCVPHDNTMIETNLQRRNN